MIKNLKIYSYLDDIREIYPSITLRINSTSSTGIVESYEGNTEFRIDNTGYYNINQLNYGSEEQKEQLKETLHNWSIDIKQGHSYSKK